ncbi:amino acid racemase [Candidatus Dojkabacteria bacterium]|uniref:Amino acid racemase n=1 Tax=Candidatus Dojkabacteria bacterium TaxID=2099670 RepID=A0A955RKX3_9BACT|nr:amino acid racemase [Candidatus Dojkabacteria bacterium]
MNTNQPPALVGILGGVGPKATLELCQHIIEYTPAVRDQDHIPLLIYNNSQIPDRIDGILGNGQSPLSELIRTAKLLEREGCKFIVIPCNNAHYFLEEIRKNLHIPVLDMISLTKLYLQKHLPLISKIGLLTTDASRTLRLHEKRFKSAKIEIMMSSDTMQRNNVMEALFGTRGIKAGYHDSEYNKSLLLEASSELITKGADAILAGCTEIPLTLSQADFSIPFIDPAKILALEIVERAMNTHVYTQDTFLAITNSARMKTLNA